MMIVSVLMVIIPLIAFFYYDFREESKKREIKIKSVSKESDRYCTLISIDLLDLKDGRSYSFNTEVSIKNHDLSFLGITGSQEENEIKKQLENKKFEANIVFTYRKRFFDKDFKKLNLKNISIINPI